MRRLVIAALLLLLTGCGGAHRNADIVSVTFSVMRCATCGIDSFTVWPNGKIDEVGDDGTHDVMSPSPIVSGLPLDEFSNAARAGVPTTTAGIVGTVDVLFSDRSSLHAVIPETPTQRRFLRLARWMASSIDMAENALYRPHAEEIYDAFARDRVTAISARRFGCFSTCVGYTVTFRRNGNASFIARGANDCTFSATARVPFSALAPMRYEVTVLRPSYPITGSENDAAEIDVSVGGTTFQSSGPDNRTWDTPFTEAISRLDQLVHDTSWKPSLSTIPCKSIVRI